MKVAYGSSKETLRNFPASAIRLIVHRVAAVALLHEAGIWSVLRNLDQGIYSPLTRNRTYVRLSKWLPSGQNRQSGTTGPAISKPQW
jgi:hypothetical protein